MLRRKIKKASAMVDVSEETKKKFKKWLKENGKSRAGAYYFDGGMTYATINDWGTTKSFTLSGTYSVQD